MESRDHITLFIVAYGAILSSLVFLWTIIKDRRQITVGTSAAFFTYANGEISTQMVSIDVVNRGHRPVHVNAPTLRIPNGKFLSFIGVDDFKKFPKRLDDGESASLCVTYDEIARTLKKQGYVGIVRMKPSCKDAAGNKYWGKKWKFNVDKATEV